MAAAIATAVGTGSLVSCIGEPIARKVINRFKEGRKLARDGLAVYIPGSGRMMDFDTHPTNQAKLKKHLSTEKWIVQYLKPSVIDLEELLSALTASKLIEISGTVSDLYEKAILVLGTVDIVTKLEGIMLAFRTGFLTVSRQGTTSSPVLINAAHGRKQRVPWKLLQAAPRPDVKWQDDPMLLDIWYALHCPYIFPVSRERVLGAAYTFGRVERASKWSSQLIRANGELARKHYEFSLENLLDIANQTNESLLCGHIVSSPTRSVRLAAMLGGAHTLELFTGGDESCSRKIMRALCDIEKAHRLGLKIFSNDDGQYVLRTEIGSKRAQHDLELVDGMFHVKLLETTTVVFPVSRSAVGTVILEKRISDLGPGEIFNDAKNVIAVCEKVDQSMLLCRKLSVTENEECRLAAIAVGDFGRECCRGEMELVDDDFACVTWAESDPSGVLLTITWRPEFKFCVVDSIGKRVAFDQIRLPLHEPTKLQFLNVHGADIDVETRHVALPDARGFRHVDLNVKYCYLQNQRDYVGLYVPVGTVGIWRQSVVEICFEKDGDGLLS